MPPYLQRRGDGKSQNFYVRLIAPKALHPYLSPQERQYRESTGTADLLRAKLIGAELVAKKRREWDELLAAFVKTYVPTPATLNDLLIRQICGARLLSWFETDNTERLGEEGLDEEQLAVIESFCQLSDARMRSILAQGKASREWSRVLEDVREWCQVLGYDISHTDPLFVQLVREFAATERRAHNFIAARNAGENPSIDVTLPTAGVKLSEVAPQYQAYKSKSVAKKSVSKNMSVWQRLVVFLGDKSLDDVTTGDIFQFLEDRLFSKHEPWSQGYVDGHAQRALKEIFSYARTVGLMTAPNPVLGLEATPKLSKSEAELRKKRKRSTTPILP